MSKMQKRITTKKNPSADFLVIGPRKLMESGAHLLSLLPIKELAFIDGGLRHVNRVSRALRKKITSPLSYGDGDSAKSPMTFLKNNQAESDLAFYLKRKLEEKKAGNYHFQGFSGGRKDHELISLGEIFQFIKKMPKSQFISKAIIDQKILCLPPGNHSCSIEGTFSIVSFEKVKITLTGDCDYQLKNKKELSPLSSYGLSNKGHGTIKLSTNKTILIMAHQKQNF